MPNRVREKCIKGGFSYLRLFIYLFFFCTSLHVLTQPNHTCHLSSLPGPAQVTNTRMIPAVTYHTVTSAVPTTVTAYLTGTVLLPSTATITVTSTVHLRYAVSVALKDYRMALNCYALEIKARRVNLHMALNSSGLLVYACQSNPLNFQYLFPCLEDKK